MAEVSPSIAERARKNVSVILRALARVGQNRVADLMGLSESAVSRMAGERIEQMAQFLAACGLRVSDEKAPTVEPEVLRSLQVLAALGAQNAAAPSEFGVFDESGER